MKRFSIFALFLLMLVSNANATITWDGGGGDNLWNTATNWVGDVVPSSTDNVLLDNSVVSGSYTVNLPSGILTVAINSLTITPAASNNITLLLPSANTSPTAFSATGSGDAVVLNSGAIFINSSGATGTPVSVTTTNFFRINNGGHYIHRTNAAHTTNLVSRLSTAPGTELGEFEFDDPSGAATLSLSNRTYGSLTLSSTAHAGTATYSGSGANALNINGNLKINTGVSLSISMSANFIVHGNYNQALSSTFTLQSSTSNNFVKLMGDVSSLGTITDAVATGLPTLELNGSTNQNIGIASITANVNFKINNPANVTLTAPLTLPYNLELTSGKIKTNSTNPLTLIDNATYSGGSSTSFVEGPMKKIGDEDFIFPVGIGSIYAPVGLFAGTGIMTDEFTAEYVRTNPQGVYGTSYAAGINHISFVEYWDIVRGASTTSQKKIRLTATAQSFCMNIANTFVSHFNGTQWTNETSTSSLTGTSGAYNLGTTTTNGIVSSFSPFTLATNLSFGANPLPIKLENFDAKKTALNSTSLNWKLASSCSDACIFEIDKSGDGRSFISLGKIKASSSTLFYSSKDNQLEKGTTFYRLKMIDEDGTITYSKIITVFNNEGGFLITSLWPNPVQSNVNVVINAAKSERLQLRIIDLAGKIIHQSNLNVTEGTNNTIINTERFASGLYQLVISGDGKIVSYRFIKQ